MSKQPTTSSKPAGQAQVYTGLLATISAELMIGFWFGIGVMLAVGVADGLNHFIRAVTIGK